MKTWMERCVSYEGDLDTAAQQVISELDDTDGVVLDTKEYRFLIRSTAALYKVGVKDLARRVQEFIS